MVISMNINTHAHLFPLRLVLTGETIRALGNRLRHKNIPEYLVKGIELFIENLAKKPHYLNEDQLLKELIKSILSTQAFKRFANNHLHEISVLNAINLDSQDLSKAALKAILNGLSAWGEANDDSVSTLFDIYETLRIALLPNTTTIAAHLLEHLEHEDALIGLMMDIRGETETERDRQRFSDQINDLREASLQFPGRVFPFFAVNPKRPDHYELMTDAIEKKGFVGIKLYPSLGYRVDHPDLIKIYDYCEKHNLPITMHCNHGGFYVKKDFISYCDPDHWSPIIEQYPKLKLCFAHFGGHESLSEPGGLEGDSWGKKIIDLMHHEDYNHIYADISYHTDMMNDPDKETHYLDKMHELLQDPIIQSRVLFGTDSWLLRMNMSDELFWTYFREKLSNQEFHQIASLNTKAFIGIDPLCSNIQQFISFQEKNCNHAGSKPPEWLLSNSSKEFNIKRDNPGWTIHKYPAHVVIASLGSQLYARQKDLAFKRQAYITMQELKFWKLHHTDQPAFDQEVRKLSLDVINQSEKVGSLEGGLTTNEGRIFIEEMIRVGSTRFIDLAFQVDTLYHFKQE